MVIGLDDREVEVGAGDCLLIPAGVAHWYENRGLLPVRFLCMVPLTERYQTEWLEPAAE
jgi:mannose-6-phosphate isomerase-like protein (cupin superfamily)